MKKLFALLLVLMLVIGTTACGNKDETKKTDTDSSSKSESGDTKENTKKDKKKETAKLTFMINFDASTAMSSVFEEVVNDFNKENADIKVEFIPAVADYEALMKTKMATNDLPDMWTTHGWSIARYSEYLTPLEGEAWAKDLHPAIEPVITDKEGHIYVLPLDVDVAGVVYNKDVVKTAGVDVTKIKTWNDFFDALEKVKQSGVTPVHMGGKDNWTVGNFFDWVAPSIYVTDEANYSGDHLKAGKFDTEKWKIAANILKEMKDEGYLNVDAVTATYSDSARALGEGSAAFEFFGNYVIGEAWTFNEDANLGFLPVPAYYEGDEPSLISGEHATVGIWKDSKYPEQARAFLNYLAKPEVMAKIASVAGIPAGLTTAQSDTGRIADSFDMYKNVVGFPYFDREYLPSGMWDTMCSTGLGVLSDGMTLDDAANKMLEDFKKLYK